MYHELRKKKCQLGKCNYMRDINEQNQDKKKETPTSMNIHTLDHHLSVRHEM